MSAKAQRTMQVEFTISEAFEHPRLGVVYLLYLLVDKQHSSFSSGKFSRAHWEEVKNRMNVHVLPQYKFTQREHGWFCWN